MHMHYAPYWANLQHTGCDAVGCPWKLKVRYISPKQYMSPAIIYKLTYLGLEQVFILADE